MNRAFISSSKHPILRRLVITQFFIFVIGILLGALALGIITQISAKSELEAQKVLVSAQLKPLQEQWRAWQLTGVTEALEKDLKQAKNRLNLESLTIEPTTKRKLFNSEKFIVFPADKLEQEMSNSILVVAKLNDSSPNLLSRLKDSYVIVISAIILFLVLIIYSNLYVRRKIHSPIDQMNMAFERVARGENLFTEEIKAEGEMQTFVVGIEKMYKAVKDKEEHEVFVQLAKQVSHDIRGPLGALQMAIQEGNTGKPLAEKALQRINEISEDLLKRSRLKKPSENHQEVFTSFDLDAAIHEIIEEKNIQLEHFKIESDLDRARGIGDIGEFKRIISNLLQNSIEATASSHLPIIKISLRSSKGKAIIYIQDNGHGIPEDIIKKIEVGGFSYNKPNGNGLGLSHAMKNITQWGGAIKLTSKEGHGTIVSLVLKADEIANDRLTDLGPISS
jgi:signal transduction histidine kinase